MVWIFALWSRFRGIDLCDLVRTVATKIACAVRRTRFPRHSCACLTVSAHSVSVFSTSTTQTVTGHGGLSDRRFVARKTGLLPALTRADGRQLIVLLQSLRSWRASPTYIGASVFCQSSWSNPFMFWRAAWPGSFLTCVCICVCVVMMMLHTYIHSTRDPRASYDLQYLNVGRTVTVHCYPDPAEAPNVCQWYWLCT